MQQIVPGVYVIPFWAGYLNIFVIETADGLALVDTGTGPKSIDRVTTALERAGRRLDEVRHVLITHAHFDHIGGLVALQERVSAQTYAHRREALAIQGEQPVAFPARDDLRGLPWLMSYVVVHPPVTPAIVNVKVTDGDTLADVLPGLQVIELTGHTYGHVGYYWPERGILFGGDALMRYPWGLRMPFRAASPDWDAVRQSIKRIATLDFDVLCLGHGRPLVGNAAAAVRQFAERL